ncbi:spore cortex biosynthesis protein YabQ [Neobacillus sedimentimangrovi]|jgi:spore cortex biosynthesis protein YabQ|uniref:Spore cortex biosynthesis protein YabQ n=1 Tax=Neobacillus sedimentimangrovi TaxID=2699460 RepID=A0ABS8QKE4_9BACI|nr:spore cortex biosynthesis protein YabQ [Neobacillus sedimentimangrovi]AIM16618.1 spore coat protein [Bacillus sp. X1(2014)]MCD4839691.1 spore cortex biosynthesis protein YabQ [Neobacillus sedimentimangrovi]
MTLSTQFLTMLSMVGIGSLFGALFDTYQRFLKRPKRKAWIVFLNDLLFWVIQALIIFYALFLVNNGEIRFYIFLALLCGFAAYQSLFKNFYLRFLEFLIRTTIAFARLVRKTFQLLIYKPVVGLVQFVILILMSVGTGMLSLGKFILKALIWVLKIVLTIVKKILLILWKLLPKNLKNSVEKLYNRTAGNLKLIWNNIIKWFNKWKKRKE